MVLDWHTKKVGYKQTLSVGPYLSYRSTTGAHIDGTQMSSLKRHTILQDDHVPGEVAARHHLQDTRHVFQIPAIGSVHGLEKRSSRSHSLIDRGMLLEPSSNADSFGSSLARWIQCACHELVSHEEAYNAYHNHNVLVSR